MLGIITSITHIPAHPRVYSPIVMNILAPKYSSCPLPHYANNKTHKQIQISRLPFYLYLAIENLSDLTVSAKKQSAPSAESWQPRGPMSSDHVGRLYCCLLQHPHEILLLVDLPPHHPFLRLVGLILSHPPCVGACYGPCACRKQYFF